jgi:tetratricopeptide (TPR) repeat protein
VLENTIAVLPFLNIDGTAATQIFANGLVDDVITQLARIPGLLVSARGDSHTLPPNTSSKEVRDRLRVAMYLEGSVQTMGDEIRVIIQLIDSESGFHVLSRRFDRRRDDFFAIRDEITELLVANVRVALPPGTHDNALSNLEAPDLDVYLAYRRGVDASRKPDVREWLDEAIHWYDAALEMDPGYAAAHAGKCDAYVEGFIWLDDPSYIDAAESSCGMALNLNPNLSVVYTALGDLYEATGRFQRAEDAYSDAMRSNPRNVPALIGLGEVYHQQQRPDEAEATFRKAIGLLPGDWSAHNALGRFLYRSGRYAEAAEHFGTVVALDKSNVRGHTNLGGALMLAEEFAAAEPVFRRALELEPSADTYGNFGMLLYYLGLFEESVQMLSAAVELEDKDHLARSNLGDAMWAAGMKTQSRNSFAAAEELATEALTVNPNDAYLMMDLAWIKTRLDKHEEARDLIERAMARLPDEPYVYYIQGLMQNRNGNRAAALESLRAAIKAGYSKKLLSVDPNLSELRRNKHFQELVDQSQ